MEIRAATLQDIPGIFSLQEKYLFGNLSQEQRLDGFVTTPFTLEQIENVIKENELFVGVDQRNIAAYTFTGSWDFFSQWPIFPYMNSRFPYLQFKGSKLTLNNSFEYGPVCIAMEYRGQGLLSLLFEEMRKELVRKYPIAVTFINKLNTRSFNAHVNKLNWTVIDEFRYNDKDYWGLAYDMKQKVQP
jgi:hypothetical protein